jgi:diguanylate cyclase (GGDEF)-like protein
MLALLFIDLDHFKQINDTLGHHVGDNVLKVVAERLKENLRNEDTLARLGGDEFTIIIEGISHIQETQKLAEKIQQVMAQPIHIDGHTLYITCSIGISIFPQDDTEPENLVKYADAAMYRAKEEGRNNYQFYSKEMTTLAYQRLMMESSLRQAIENDEFKLYYQPQYNGATGELVGLEALIRWQHPEMGLLHPERFIPLAEESDLIVEIDRWVMRTAMVQYSKWYAKGLYPGKLGLNLSMRQLGSSDFMAKLARCLEKTSFRPEWLEFEVTESQVMKRPEESIEKLNSIHNKGISISIDDFGTGYSSLAYLKRLPVSRLKIDQSFVRDIPENKEDVGIVKAIIALSKSLGIGIIAEGVETKEQKLFLLVHGCQEMQGYYYSKPLASEKIEEMLGKRNES